LERKIRVGAVSYLNTKPLLYGIERDWPLLRCIELGNRVGAIKIACRGGQNHVLPLGGEARS